MQNIMKYVIIIVRVLLGLVFAVFGSNAFLHFIPMPPMEGQAGAFIGALISSGYIYVIAALQVVGGLLLLIGGRFVALGLTLLGPVIVNIMLYHIFLDTSGLPMACITSVFALFLLWAHRDRFPAIFQP
jgi:putative oxidoreductase